MGNSYLLETVDGAPVGSTKHYIDQILTALAGKAEPKLLLHAHGGLVDADEGKRQAVKIDNTLRTLSEWERGYFIWHTGIWDVVFPGVKAVDQDKLAGQLRSHVGGWIGERASVAKRRALTNADSDVAPAAEIRARLIANHEANSRGEPLKGRISREVERRLKRDPAFIDLTDRMEAYARGGPGRVQLDSSDAAQSWNNLDDDVRAKMSARALRGEHGVRDVVVAQAAAAAVLMILRFLRGRDHGLQATLFEEIARALYLGRVGSIVWREMKDDAARHVSTEGAAGSMLLAGLDRIAAAGKPVELVVVGHSAGCVLALHLLEAAKTLSANLKIRMVFWASAATHALAAKILDARGLERLSSFAMLNLTDEAEKDDPLNGQAPGDPYPRSLLYLVSGVLDGDGPLLLPHPDAPLLGMERHRHIKSRRLTKAEKSQRAGVVAALRTYKDPAWTCPCGTDCSIASHGGFSEDAKVHATTVRLVQSGFDVKPVCPGQV